MTATTNDSFAKAVAYLGAVEVAPGRFAFKGDDSRWYTIAERDLVSAHVAKPLMQEPPVLMPACWTPEQRFAYRYKVVDATGSEMEGYEDKRWPEAFDFGMERITADLETGAEVPA